MKKVILEGDERTVENIIKENRIRVGRGLVKFSPAEDAESEVEQSGDDKVVEDVDSKETEMTDDKEVNPSDSKETEVHDKKKVKNPKK